MTTTVIQHPSATPIGTTSSHNATRYSIPEPAIMPLPVHLDSTTVATFDEDTSLCITSGLHTLILDAQETTSITAHGVHTLLRLAARIKAVQGKLYVANLSGQALSMITTCGIQKIIPSIQTIAAPIEASSPSVHTAHAA